MSSVTGEPRRGRLRGRRERVRHAVAAVAATDPHPSDPFRGLYVSDEAALALASGSTVDGVDDRIASAGALLGLEGLDSRCSPCARRRSWTRGSAGC